MAANSRFGVAVHVLALFGANPVLHHPSGAENVRAALVLVARGEAPLGIVYETDVKIDPGVKIVGIFPEDSHPPIIYPVALTKDAKPDAAQYLAFLHTQTARTAFERYGFSVLAKP